METVETWPKDVQGTRVDAAVRATDGDTTVGESGGDVLFTSYGVSGPAVMALAGAIAPLLPNSRVVLHIDPFPDMTEGQLREIVARHAADRSAEDALAGLMPGGLIPVVARIAGLGGAATANTISVALKDLTLTVSQLRRLREAQVTAGGVAADEINPLTLESRLLPGLYFAGEVIDVDGDSGGFNLQWAWSSGHVAGLLGE
jgi:predicted Rossmann fold flavoprotein